MQYRIDFFVQLCSDLIPYRYPVSNILMSRTGSIDGLPWGGVSVFHAIINKIIIYVFFYDSKQMVFWKHGRKIIFSCLSCRLIISVTSRFMLTSSSQIERLCQQIGLLTVSPFSLRNKKTSEYCYLVDNLITV